MIAQVKEGDDKHVRPETSSRSQPGFHHALARGWPSLDRALRGVNEGAGALAVAALQAAVHLCTSGLYGLHRDELYLLACGRRAAWGSIDHAPLAPALSRLLELLFAASPTGQRLPDILAGAATVLFTGLCARRLGGGRTEELVAAGAVALAPVFFFASGVHGTNAVDQLCFAASGWLILRIVARGAGAASPAEWLSLGAVVGVGFQGKYTALLCAGAALAAVLATPARAQLRGAWPWLSAAIALGIASPTLWWQASHGWPALEFLRESNLAARQRTALWRIVADQPRLLHPVGFALAVIGVSAGLLRAAAPAMRAASVAVVVTFAALLALHGKPYYAAAAAPLGLAAGAVASARFLRTQLSARRRFALLALWLSTGAAALAGTLPILPQAIRESLRLNRLNPELIQFASWEGHVARIAGLARSAGLGEATILTDSYGTAAAVEVLGASHGLSRPLSGANAYYALRPLAGPDQLLALGYPPALLATLFEEVAEVGVVRSPGDLDNRFDFPRVAYACRRRKRPLADAWPELRRFD